MNQRERILASAVAGMAVVMGSFWGYRKVDASFRLRKQTLDRLEKDKSAKARIVRAGQLAQERLQRYNARSLPPDAKLAEQLYMDWLLKTVTEIGFSEPKVNPMSGALRSRTDAFKAQAFAVSGSGSLEMVVQLLHQFYSVDYLHRIKVLNVISREPNEAKRVAFSMTVEALSLPDAEAKQSLELPPSRRLASDDVKTYIDAICGRNIFGPVNAPPQLNVRAEPGQTNREVTLAPTATDADRVDSLTFSWKSTDVQDAKFDPKTGKLSWTPRKPGEYYVTIGVEDDGVPKRSAEEKVKIVVADPPPPQPRVEAPKTNKPPYDQVKFAIVNGIVESDGQRIVWLHDRTRDKIHYLREGEKFKIGTFEGAVKHIGNTDVEFEWYGLRALVPMGEKLSEDKELQGDELINLRDTPNAS